MKTIKDYQPAAAEIVYWLRALPTVIEAAYGSLYGETQKAVEEVEELNKAVLLENIENTFEEWADVVMVLAQIAQKLPPDTLEAAIVDMVAKNAERGYLA